MVVDALRSPQRAPAIGAKKIELMGFKDNICRLSDVYNKFRVVGRSTPTFQWLRRLCAFIPLFPSFLYFLFSIY